MAAEKRLDGVYNLGTGESYSFNTVVEMLNEELETNIEPEYVENPIPEDIYLHDMMMDILKTKGATRWVPEIGFEEGIEQVCAQYRSYQM